MSLFENILIFLVILNLYFLLVLTLKKRGVLKKYNISLWGPALMWRTERGKRLIEKIAQKKRRFWIYYANIGIGICFVLMILMLWLLISILPVTLQTRDTIASSHPQIIIGIPVINPIIPLGYGILGLLVALIVHEFSHGILSRAGKLKIKSLGILYFIVPIGAFCEPDEEELKKTRTMNRIRIYAAGPTSNIVTALICMALISIMITTMVQPAANGVGIYSVASDTPAEEIDLKQGMIITYINGTQIHDVEDFYKAMNNTMANQSIKITLIYRHTVFTKNVTLIDKYDVYMKHYDIKNTSLIEQFKGKGYLGVGTSTFFKRDLVFLKNPFISMPISFLYYLSLPLIGFLEGYNPINTPFSDFYIINGFVPENLFWIIINSLYWIFWINFMAATFNVLPMIPLDGGYMFRDTLDSFIKRIKKDISHEKREKITRGISTIVSLLILILVLSPILIPNLRGLF